MCFIAGGRFRSGSTLGQATTAVGADLPSNEQKMPDANDR
jgi:hypothetical protein